MEAYRFPAYSKFSLMKDLDYDMEMDLVANLITSDEKKAVDAAWYSVVSIGSLFIMDGFTITNQLKLADDDFAFISPLNL